MFLRPLTKNFTLLPSWTAMLCRCVVAVGALQGALPAQAMGLMELYERALQFDPVTRGARHERDAGMQSEAIGRAALLPQVSFSYSTAQNLSDREFPNAQGRAVNDTLNYRSMSAAIQLRQPLFDWDALARFRLGKVQARQSEVVFDGRSRELMARVTEAYLQVLLAEEQLRLTRAQQSALEEQRKANERLFEKGEGTRTDVLETQSRYDLAVAMVIEAQDTLEIARQTIAAISGPETLAQMGSLDGLRETFSPMPMVPRGLAEWRDLALANNPEVAAQRYTVEATAQQVERSRADHLPRLSLVASVGRSESDTITAVNQQYDTKSIGVQFVLPLYAGGGVSAQLAQSKSKLESARADLDAKTARMLVEIQQQFYLVVNGGARIEALNKAVESGRLTVEATEKSVLGGLRINADVLTAKRELYIAQRDLAKARYDYLSAWVKLRYTAGTLMPDDLQVLKASFEPRGVIASTEAGSAGVGQNKP